MLWHGYDQIVREAISSPGPPPEVLSRRDAIDPTGPYFGRVLEAIKKLGAERSRPQRAVSRLTEGFRGPHEPIQPTSDGEPVQAPALAKSRPKISVVVVSFNMARETPRTIRSLSPLMQRGIDAADVEVILVDNGSTEPFDETELRRIVPDLIVRRVADATPSPVPAVNLALGLARADLVGVCIDGARMTSPPEAPHELFAQEYVKIRGCHYERPRAEVLYFGTLPEVLKYSIKQPVSKV